MMSVESKPMVTTVRPWGETNDAHLRIEKTDRRSAGKDYERRLHVCPALPNGLHVGISIWGVHGNEDQHHTGINLTPAEAVELIAQITKVLGHGEWEAE